MANPPYFNDHLQALVYKCCKSTEPLVASPEIAYFNDKLQTLIFKLTSNLQALNGGVGTELLAVRAPSSPTDFSMFGSGVAPSSGIFIALSDTKIYIFEAGTDTTWQETPRP